MSCCEKVGDHSFQGIDVEEPVTFTFSSKEEVYNAYRDDE